MTKKTWFTLTLTLLGSLLIGCILTLGLYWLDHQEIQPLQGGQTWDLSALGFTLRVPEDATLADHTRENAELGDNALYAGSATQESGILYLFCYANETGDSLEDYEDQELVSYYMQAGATEVRTRILAGHRFVCYRALVNTADGIQTWDTYETWDETLQLTFETQMKPSSVLPILSTLATPEQT